MTPERWRQVDRLLQDALERPPAERAAFLTTACGGDEALRGEVEALLGLGERAESFFGTPPADVAADWLAAQESRAGETVGHYRIERRLGVGGMGVVYLARDTRLGRPVALKLLRADRTQDPARLRRFQREARAASALNHPNILTIHEVGEVSEPAGRAHFIAAEFIDGQTLRALCRSHKLTLGAALDILIQTADALTAAHGAGIIHRDIKPENIMLRGDGLVKVLDFGLAKLTERRSDGATGRQSEEEAARQGDKGTRRQGEGEVWGQGAAAAELAPSSRRPVAPSVSRPVAQSLTTPGLVIGTIHYMSPEQARGLALDERSDLFSLGVVMYELLTGHAPFAGATTGDALVALVSEEPRPLAQQVERLPAALQEIVTRALAKPVEQRYQTARALAADLRRLKEDLAFAAKLKGRSGSKEDLLTLIVGASNDGAPHTSAKHVTTKPATGHYSMFATRPVVEPVAPPRAAEAGATTQAGAARWLTARAPARWLVLTAALVLLIGGAVLARWWRSAPRGSAIDAVAVLPFTNVGDDPQMAYLPDGITESLIDSLSQLPALRVSARATVASYKGREVDPRQAGKELQVRAIITGRVVWQGERLLIRVELADATDGSVMWGDEFRYTRADIVAAPGEITRAVSARLHRQLSPAGQQQLAKRHSQDGKAYELYAQGRYLYLQYNRPSQEKALDYFDQAIARDPHYALAYSGLADVYADLSSQSLAPSEAIPKARAAALKAVELDEALPEAHHSLGLVKLWGDWDWAGAEREYRRALELAPNLVLTRIYYAGLLSDQRRFDEALREIRRAEEYDPASLQALGREGYTYYEMRQYERAIDVYRKILGLSPNATGAQRGLALVLSQQEKHQEAIAQTAQFPAAGAALPLSVVRAYIRARAGQRSEALKLMRELQARAARDYVSPVYFAQLYVSLGDTEQALVWLRKAYEDRSDHLLHVGVDPRFDPLRADPRFAALLRGVGLTP